MGLTDVYVTVSNPDDPSRSRELEFLVDSGATFSVVPREILSDLGIVPDGFEYFKLADLTRIQREVGEASFTFQGKTRSSPVMFGEEGDATLLGVMTLEALALVLDPVRQELRPMELRL
jgi:clan AA aspartic protease